MTTLLLVPAPEHREALLRERACGMRPPVARSREDGSWRQWAGRVEDAGALVLAWEGIPSPEGCDRAIRVRNAAVSGIHRTSPQNTYEVAEAEWIGADCAARGLGTLVHPPGAP